MSQTIVCNIEDLNKRPEIEKPTTPSVATTALMVIQSVNYDVSVLPGMMAIYPTSRADLDKQLKDKKERISFIPQHGHIAWKDSKTVKDLFELIGVLVDEATFEMKPSGLTLRAMDPSRVAMIDLNLPREQAEEFLCPENMKFCFNVSHFAKKTLKNVYKDEAIKLDIDIHNPLDTLKTYMVHKLKRNFSTPLLECSDEQIPTPKITFNYQIKLILENLNTLFKEDVSDHVVFIGTNEGLTFQQDGDLDKFSSTMQKGDDTVLEIEARESEVKACYSVSYLKEFLKFLNPLTDIVTLRLSTDMPLEVEAEVGYLGTVKFYLAPRIDLND